MPEIIEGEVTGRGLRFAIIVGRYNSFVTERLLAGALDALTSRETDPENIAVFKVPGSFEIPQMARRVAEQREYDAIICLGALIRGQTLHFQIISEECARGLQQVAAHFNVPITFGVITAENMEQAVDRAGAKSENKGWEASMAAMEMANLFKRLR